MSDFNTLVTKHRLSIDRVQTGKLNELPQRTFEDFFDHYLSTGELPYGVAKARTGDPYHWINARVLEDVKKVSLF